jgi:hypothetical protein
VADLLLGQLGYEAADAAAAAGMGGALLGNRWEIVGTFRREGLLSKAPPS